MLTSTTYVGSTRELLVEPLAERGLTVGEDVFVAFAPERIDPGVKDHEQLQTPRVVGGVTEGCFQRAAEVLRHTCKYLHRVSSPEAAEMVKLYENTFRAVNIALAFEIAEACQAHGLDPIEVTDGAATKPYGFMAHYPSAGVGGHCIGVDPYYLLHDLRDRGRPAMVAEQALRKVTGRPRHVAWRAHELLVGMQRSLRRRTHPGGRRVLQARRGRHARSASGRDHRPLARRGRARRLPRSARAEPASRQPRAAIGVAAGDAGGYDLAIIATLHPEHDYGWLEAVRRGARLHLPHAGRWAASSPMSRS